MAFEVVCLFVGLEPYRKPSWYELSSSGRGELCVVSLVGAGDSQVDPTVHGACPKRMQTAQVTAIGTQLFRSVPPWLSDLALGHKQPNRMS